MIIPTSSKDVSCEPGPAADLCEILLEAATPELYRVNAFRVLELPVDATAREIARRAEMLKVMEKLGASAPKQNGPLALDPAPDANAIRDAVQRLHDPERRLVDEFFWFWPWQLGQGKNDPVLKTLAAGDVKAAHRVWRSGEQQSSDGNVSMHNIAVLNHVIALHLEHASRSRQLTESQVKARDSGWQHAFKRWQVLLEYEGFWSRLTARIRDHNDPRLTTGVARRFRMTLPLALLSINAQLAVQATERGDSREAKRHRRIILKSGFDPSAMDGALRRALKPIRERVKTFCRTADSEADADPENADKVTRRLLDQTGPLLGILDCLLAADDPARSASGSSVVAAPDSSLASGNALRDGAHDEVAQATLQCQVTFGAKTDNWKVSLDLLDCILPVAAGEAARVRIEENRQIVKRTLEYKLEYETCFFCKRRDAETEAAAEVPMYGDVTRDWTYEGTSVNWRYLTVKVPRCTACKAAQARVEACTVAGLVLPPLLVAAIAFLAGTIGDLGEDVIGPAILIGLASAVVGAIVGHRLGYTEGVKPESAKTAFSGVKTLQEQGWDFGSQPPGVQ